MDAVLPPVRGSVPLAPPAFVDFLREKADDDGLLQMWTNRWDQSKVARLLPDVTTRARVEREQGRFPLSYFEGSLPVAEGWDDRPAAYLAFGETYGPEREGCVSLSDPLADTRRRRSSGDPRTGLECLRRGINGGGAGSEAARCSSSCSVSASTAT